jgi:hypothetical protein
MHGDGNGGNGAEGAARPTVEEALAAFGEPRDRLDRIALFVGEQTINIGRMIESQTRGTADLLKLQSDAMISMMRLLGEQIEVLTREIASLKGERGAEERNSLQ